MALHKNIGDEAYNTETGDGEEDVSYTPEESEAQSEEEKSDEQLIAEGKLEIDDGGDGVFIDPNSNYQTQPGGDDEQEEEDEEPGEEETPEEEDAEEDEKEEPQEEPQEEEKPKKKRKTGQVDPEVKRLAKRFSQKRINKISREKFKLRDENEALKKELAELKKKSRDVDFKEKRAEHASKRPSYDDFESEAEYHEALGRWAAKDEIYEHEASKPQEEEEKVEPKALAFEEARDRIISDGEDSYDDFAEIVLRTDGSIAISPEMVLAAADSDNAADIFYYLGKNPEESHRIAGMTDFNKIAREMGKLESLVSMEVEEQIPEEKPKGKKKKAAPKKKTKATPPAPVKPLGGGGRAATDLDKAGMDDYARARGYVRDGGGGWRKKRTNN